MKHGWCTRCGHAYEAPGRPSCECAGDPPVTYRGTRRPNFDPEMRAYLERVRGLRYVPTATPRGAACPKKTRTFVR